MNLVKPFVTEIIQKTSNLATETHSRLHRVQVWDGAFSYEEYRTSDKRITKLPVKARLLLLHVGSNLEGYKGYKAQSKHCSSHDFASNSANSCLQLVISSGFLGAASYKDHIWPLKIQHTFKGCWAAVIKPGAWKHTYMRGKGRDLGP